MAAFIGLRVDEETKSKLVKLAERRGVSVNELLGDLLAQKARNIPNADLLRIDRFKKALSDANVSAVQLVDHLHALQKLKAEIEDEVQKLSHRYEEERGLGEWFWGDSAALKAIRERVEDLRTELATCDVLIQEVRVHILGGNSVRTPTENQGLDEQGPTEEKPDRKAGGFLSALFGHEKEK
jgi:hypothetical protein